MSCQVKSGVCTGGDDLILQVMVKNKKYDAWTHIQCCESCYTMVCEEVTVVVEDLKEIRKELFRTERRVEATLKDEKFD